MFVLPLGIATILSSVAIYFYAANRGGSDATLDIFGKVVSGSLVQAVAVVLLLVGLLLVVSTIVKTMRRIALLVAAAAVLGGGSVAAIVPKSVAAYERQNNCVVFDGSCVNASKIVPSR